MKKETLMNVAGIVLFYLVIVLGVITLNARMRTINESPVITAE